MIDVYDTGKHTGHFDEVWPRMESAFVKMMTTVTASVPDVAVDARAYKMTGSRFHAYVAFTYSSSHVYSTDKDTVVVEVMCGNSFSVQNDLSVSASRGRIDCMSLVVAENDRRRSRDGPSIQFELVNDVDARRQLDHWADASVTFFGQNTDWVIRQVEAIHERVVRRQAGEQ